MQKTAIPRKRKSTNPPLLAGTASCEIATDLRPGELRDPLLVKAMVLTQGRTKTAILSLDAVVIGGIGDISNDFLPALLDRIEEKRGIPADAVLVHATHTHPSGRMICEPRKLLDRSFAAVRQAFNNQVAALYNDAGRPLLGAPDGSITAHYPGFASAVIEEQLGSGAIALFLQGAGGDQGWHRRYEKTALDGLRAWL